MHESELVLEVVRGWVQKAENDLTNATLTLRAGEKCPADTVAFHAQQCVEKYLKALLTSRAIDFPKTHDIEELIALVSRGIRLDLSIEEQRRLTVYATVTRYPGVYEPVSIAEARQAVAICRRVRKVIRAALPRELLRRKKN